MFEDSARGNETGVSVAKSMYKPLSVASSVLGGLLAGKIFTELYQRANPSGNEPPEPSDLSSSARDIFIAAAVQGLIVGVVRAALARGQAKGFHAITKEDPEV
jgi:hypothetical protein